jgi:hypothetical protein
MNRVKKRWAGGMVLVALLLGGCAMQVDEPQPSPAPVGSTPVQRCAGPNGACSRWLGGAQVATTPQETEAPTNPDPMPWNGDPNHPKEK